MRKLLMAILVLAGASSLLFIEPVPSSAQNDEGVIQKKRPDLSRVARTPRLRTSQLDPDTTWIGHVYDAAFTAGGTMPAGGYGPYHVGAGHNWPTRAGSPVSLGDNGTWDFDRFQAG